MKTSKFFNGRYQVTRRQKHGLHVLLCAVLIFGSCLVQCMIAPAAPSNTSSTQDQSDATTIIVQPSSELDVIPDHPPPLFSRRTSWA